MLVFLLIRVGKGAADQLETGGRLRRGGIKIGGAAQARDLAWMITGFGFAVCKTGRIPYHVLEVGIAKAFAELAPCVF